MIKIVNVTKRFYLKEQEFIALDDVNLTFKAGEFIAILGESGSGKTTLLNMISGIDDYTDGDIIIDGVSTKKFNDATWRKFRNKNIGFVFQRYNLVEHLSTIENVTLPLMYAGENRNVYNGKAKKIISDIGLSEHLYTSVSKLSGGEKQRVAIARSMLAQPKILLCDEPTGALDSASATSIMKLIRNYVNKDRIVILVTHDEKIAYEYADRIIRIDEGVIVSDEYNDKMPQGEEILEAPEKKEKVNEKQILKQKTKNYKKVNRRFIRFISNANFRQNRASNMKIIASFVIGLSILFIINLVLKNILIHNKTMFERNNDYQRYYIDDYDDVQALKTLEKDDLISEVGFEKHYLIETSYLKYKGKNYYSNYVKSVNDVHNVELITLPKLNENFHLKDHLLIEKEGKKPTNGVYVTTELIYNHYFNRSFYKDDYKSLSKELTPFLKNHPIDSFLNESIYICGDSDSSICFETKIVGIIDSNYNGLNYSGYIFISSEGFDDFIDYLHNDLGYIESDNLYISKPYFYFKEFNGGNNKISEYEKKYDIEISNIKIEAYKQTKLLESFAYFIILFIMISIFIIFGTVVMNIISFNIDSRTKDIGVYTSIGVSRTSIKRIFIRETLKVLFILVSILVVVYAIILFLFNNIYDYIITHNMDLIKDFGRLSTISFEIEIFCLVILATIILYLVSVYVPALKVSRKKAVETLSW